jgi:hypothetical protein
LQGPLLNMTSTQKSPESTPDHDSVATVVLHKHHSISRVGAGLLQFVPASTRTLVARGPFHQKSILPISPASFSS